MVSIDSKRGELKEFYKLLSDLKNHKPLLTQKIVKIQLKIISINFTINILIPKKRHDREDLNEQHKSIFDPNQFKIFGKKEQKPKSTERSENHYCLK